MGSTQHWPWTCSLSHDEPSPAISSNKTKQQMAPPPQLHELCIIHRNSNTASKKKTTNNSNPWVKLCVTVPDWIMRWFVWKRCVTARNFLVLILPSRMKRRIDGLDEAVLRNSVRFKVKSWLQSNFSTAAAVGFTARLHILGWKSTKSEECDVNSGSLLLAFISWVEMWNFTNVQFGGFLS